MNPVKRRKWKPKGAFNMQQLPLAILMDILLKLSIKTLCNCRCVCKDWLRMISDPRFADLRRLTSPISILIKTLAPKRAQRKLDLIHVEKSAGYPMRIERMRFSPQNSIPCSISDLELINSCKGLICFSERESRYGSMYVCNPILGEYIYIPSPDEAKSYIMDVAGIGFSAKTNEYKVMQTSYNCCSCRDPATKIYYRVMQTSGRARRCIRPETVICTIGTGVWRSLGKPPILRFEMTPFNSLLHGALHWIAISRNRDLVVQSFDFEIEEFRALAPPESLKVVKQYDNFSMGVLKGCLYLCVFGGNDGKSELWIMQDYGVQKSWTKSFVIENLNPRGYNHPVDLYVPIMFLNDVEILMTYKGRFLVLYNRETKCLQKTRIVQTRSQFLAFGYYPSFVSLHAYNISNGEEVKRIRDCKKN